MKIRLEQYLKDIEYLKKNLDKKSKTELFEEIERLSNIKPIRRELLSLKVAAMRKWKYPVEEILSVLEIKQNFPNVTKDTVELAYTYKDLFKDWLILDFYRWSYLSELYDEGIIDKTFGDLLRNRIIEYSKDFFRDINVNFDELIYHYYYLSQLNVMTILSLLKDRINGQRWDIYLRDWIDKSYNMGFLIESIQSKKQNCFIIMEADNLDSLDCKVVAKALSVMGKQVFLIRQPVACPVDNAVELYSTLAVTLDNAEQVDNMTILNSIALVKNNEIIGDNRDYIISHITDNLTEDHFAVVLCSGDLLDDLELRPSMQKSLQRLSPFESDYLNRNMAFAWAGDYLAYCSFLYGFDAKAMLNAPSECDYSIVVPARNSAYSLRHTLRTCLNQRFKGSYEIVLSDNSSDGNTEIYDLYLEFNDSRIKYFRTPRELPLTKSFEFAFLQARGKAVLPIGSDDGVLPWALEVMDKVFIDNPDLEVFAWDRGFYAWPGFNRGQQHQFCIPGTYKKNQFGFQIFNSQRSLRGLLDKPDFMYVIPLIYLNSACKRSYFHQILKNTGRLWDGVCQDIYMGIVNLAIHENIFLLKYPLTIAGMSNSSMGLVSSIAHEDSKQASDDTIARQKVHNMGGYCLSRLERLLPMVNFDEASLYFSVIRLIERGCLPFSMLDEMNWQTIYLNMARKLSKRDIRLEQKLDYFRYAAKQISPELECFVEKHICEPLLEPQIFLEADNESIKKIYEVGFVPENGGLILDASDFGVENVYDATILFEKLTGL